MIYLIISLVVFWAYVGYVRYKIGPLKSISDSYFAIKTKWSWLFRCFIAGISIPMILYAKSVSIPIFYAGLFILAVGFAPGFKNDKIQSANHVIGATGGILLAYIGLALFVNWSAFYKDLYFYAIVLFLISSVIILPLGKLKKPVPYHTWWIEVVAYNIIILTLIIDNL
jgi:hypothetical protein